MDRLRNTWEFAMLIFPPNTVARMQGRLNVLDFDHIKQLALKEVTMTPNLAHQLCEEIAAAPLKTTIESIIGNVGVAIVEGKGAYQAVKKLAGAISSEPLCAITVETHDVAPLFFTRYELIRIGML